MNPNNHVSMLTWSSGDWVPLNLQTEQAKNAQSFSRFLLHFPLSCDSMGSPFPQLSPALLLCFASATFDCWLSLNCVLETQLCFCYPLCGDESQMCTASQDLVLSRRSFTVLSLVLRVSAISILCKGRALSCRGITALAVPLPGNLFFSLSATVACSHPSARSSNITSAGWLDYLVNV